METKDNECYFGRSTVVFCLYVFGWLGLGTPFIWLRQNGGSGGELYYKIWIVCLLILSITLGLCILFNFAKRCLWSNMNVSLLALLAFMFVSVIWAQSGLIAKLQILIGLYLSIAVGVCAIMYLKLSEIFVVLSVSIFSHIFPTILFHDAHLPMYLLETIFVYFVSFFVFGTILISKSMSCKIVALVILALSYGFMFYALNSSSELRVLRVFWNGSEVIMSHPGFGLFLNENLYNRMLQFGFLSSVVAAYLLTAKISTFRMFICMLLISGFFCYLLAGHVTDNGRLVLAGTFLTLVAWLIQRTCSNYISNKLWLRIFGWVLALIVTSLLAVLLLAMFYPDELKILPLRSDFVDRLNLWVWTLKFFGPVELLFGAGLGGFWGNPMYQEAKGSQYYHVIHAHNGGIEAFLNLGLIGFLLIVLAVNEKMRSYLKIGEPSPITNDEIVCFTVLMAGFILSNAFEANFLPTSSSNLLPLSVLVIALIQKNERQSL